MIARGDKSFGIEAGISGAANHDERINGGLPLCQLILVCRFAIAHGGCDGGKMPMLQVRGPDA